jgi:hypothetical protein
VDGAKHQIISNNEQEVWFRRWAAFLAERKGRSHCAGGNSRSHQLNKFTPIH